MTWVAKANTQNTHRYGISMKCTSQFLAKNEQLGQRRRRKKTKKGKWWNGNCPSVNVEYEKRKEENERKEMWKQRRWVTEFGEWRKVWVAYHTRQGGWEYQKYGKNEVIHLLPDLIKNASFLIVIVYSVLCSFTPLFLNSFFLLCCVDNISLELHCDDLIHTHKHTSLPSRMLVLK